MSDYQNVQHEFAPVFDKNSRILILGTLPSVKSRMTQFYYGHPQNRFWKVLAGLTCEAVPVSVQEKKELLWKHGIALWDVITSCDIAGSSDSRFTQMAVQRKNYMKNIRDRFMNGRLSACPPPARQMRPSDWSV